jgi:AraC-like DNA-binding protein
MSTLQVRPFMDALRELGLDAGSVLAHAGLTAAQLDDPLGRVDANVGDLLWEAAVRESGDPALSLRVAERFALGAFGTFEYLLQNCASLPEAVEHANAYMRLIDDLARVELHETSGHTCLRLLRVGGFPMSPLGVECTFALLCIKGQALGAMPEVLRAVRFTHLNSAPIARYVAHFGCEVQFGADANELVFDTSRMQDQLPGDPNLRSVLATHAREQLARIPEGEPLLHEVRRHLLEQLERGTVDPGVLARRVRMSERTLRRRLQAAGTRYQDLLDELRAQLARQYVQRPDADVTQVAIRLGFADPSTFYRAFKRWTGLTPAQFQRQTRS